MTLAKPQSRFYVMSRYRMRLRKSGVLKALKPSAVSFLFALSEHGDVDGFCFPKVETLCDELGLSTRSGSRHVAELVALGFLRVNPRRDRRGYFFKLLEPPAVAAYFAELAASGRLEAVALDVEDDPDEFSQAHHRTAANLSEDQTNDPVGVDNLADPEESNLRDQEKKIQQQKEAAAAASSATPSDEEGCRAKFGADMVARLEAVGFDAWDVAGKVTPERLAQAVAGVEKKLGRGPVDNAAGLLRRTLENGWGVIKGGAGSPPADALSESARRAIAESEAIATGKSTGPKMDEHEWRMQMVHGWVLHHKPQTEEALRRILVGKGVRTVEYEAWLAKRQQPEAAQ